MNKLAFYAAYHRGEYAHPMLEKLKLLELNKNASDTYVPLSTEEFEKLAGDGIFVNSLSGAYGKLSDWFGDDPSRMWALGGAGLGALLSENPLWGALLGGLLGWGGYKFLGGSSDTKSNTSPGGSFARGIGEFLGKNAPGLLWEGGVKMPMDGISGFAEGVGKTLTPDFLNPYLNNK